MRQQRYLLSLSIFHARIYKEHSSITFKDPNITYSSLVRFLSQSLYCDYSTHISKHIKMKLFLLVAAIAVPTLAMPEAEGVSLNPRDKVKLNQYRTLDDW